MRSHILSLALLLLLVCTPSVATAQVRDEPKGMTFESTLPPAITKEQEQQWLVFLLEELHARYHKEWKTEEVNDYFVAMLLEICMHDEAQLRVAATSFYSGGTWPTLHLMRMRTLCLPLETLILYHDHRSIMVLDGQLKLTEKYRGLLSIQGLVSNPFDSSPYRSLYDEMKELFGLRDLTPFVKQRFSDEGRMIHWRSFSARVATSRKCSKPHLHL